MRNIFLLFFLATSIMATGQFYISPGAQVQLAGNALLTLQDMDFINNGNFSAGNSTVYFSGGNDALLEGATPTQFYTIQINKAADRSLVLQQSVGVSNEVQFSQGLLNLNGHNLDLSSSGLLTGESEASRIVGTAGGEVILTTLLNAPTGADPGNLGCLISSPQNLGSVIIRRGHQAQNLTDGSILRYFMITPANNNGLGATLRFRYFDAELNGLPEDKLALWRNEDGVNWEYQGFTTRDATLNYAEKTGIDAFSTWTLSTPADPLPVTFTSFNLQCESDKITIRWKTAQEANSSHFVIERNTGAGWTGIGRLPAAGNSNIEKSYEFTDRNTAGRTQYRIAQYDIDGRLKYTSVAIADCATTDALQVWPNPFHQAFIVKINSRGNGSARLRVVDAKGSLIISNQLKLLRGLNQFEVDLQQAAKGVYLLTVEWADGQHLKTMRLIKQ